MRASPSFGWLFWAALYCVLYLVSARDEDLMDFDFSDLKEIDWNYDNENGSHEVVQTAAGGDQKLQHNMVNFEDYGDVSNRVRRPFDWREKLLRSALAKAMTNVGLRQKFIEVLPILRVLSTQQRLALSALISAQISAKKGQELKLDQVRSMFGDDKKLILPIVYDIANLVRNSARKYLQFEFEAVPAAQQQQTHFDRRNFELTPEEAADEHIGTIPISSVASEEGSLEDFFADMPDDVLDPKSINEALQAGMKHSTTKAPKQRARRDIQAQPTEFVHKLMRSIPLSVNEEELQAGAAGRTVKLNTTGFLVPSEETTDTAGDSDSAASSADEGNVLAYQQVEDLAFASLNGTEVNLSEDALEAKEADEPLPSPEELIAGPRYRIAGNKIRPPRPKVAMAKRKRVQVRPRPKISPSSDVNAAQLAKKCERFTASMCIRTDDYPLDQIMGSIRRHKYAMSALLAEFHDKPTTNGLGFSDDFDEFPFNKRRREDEATGGGMCQSVVRYARPQKARSASGEWKYIVNTGQHTQTLRLEKCTNPQESCSYLAHSYRSHCSQVYNYHRLLSWDKTRGLHVDIFKVPTCCSCQVDGYRQQFPPLAEIKSKDYSPAQNLDSYSTINEELDYNDEEDEDDLSYQFSNGFGQQRPDAGRYDANELQLATKKVRTQTYAPTPTVGSYLSPPGNDEYDTKYSHKGHTHSQRQATSPNNLLSHVARRRPYKSLNMLATNEPRVDLEIAPSETHTDKEVNFLGTTPKDDKQRLQQKRKRIYSVPHTATSTVTSAAAAPTRAGTSGGRPNGSSTYTATAHQTSAEPAPQRTTSTAATHPTHTSIPQSRFTASAPTSTESGFHYPSPSPVLSQIYYVNSLYSAKLNTSQGAAVSGPKRINYSYHPIIDFFENNKRSPATGVQSTKQSVQPASELLFPYKIPNSTPVGSGGGGGGNGGVYAARERRIGFGAGSSSVSAQDNNAWHPVVVES